MSGFEFRLDLVAASALVLGIYACGAGLNRRDDIAALRRELAALRAAPVEVAPDPRLDQLAIRTEYLRTVLRVLVREQYEAGDRVRLPDPPPGWPAIVLSSDKSKSNGHSAKRAWRNQ